MPRYKQTARWAGEDSGATPRWQPSQRASFESDVARFLEHTDDSDTESHPQLNGGGSFDSDTAESLDQLDDSDIESHPDGARDLGKKASLTLPESRLHGRHWHPLFHRPLPISHILSSNKWKQSTDSAVLKTEENPKEDKHKDEKPKEKPKEENPKEENPKEENPKEENPKEENPKEENPKEENPKEKPSFANHQKHKTLSDLRFSLESRIASAEAGLERLGTDSSGNDGHFFLHFPLEVLHIAGLATFCVWVLRRLADLESRITAEAA
ncbi:hypothetical protein B0H65DRAFT_422404 [Neurospora tetraspora]|uniref:Uncharacterized protein n=1 Tax=Neurospora tetraspora TaxID=94610 RepID=A0AAE0JHX0_9PEZI|nr:hypothetical protein B0H65DRAFT_422404 [Neurospora tetraspora]